MADDLETLVRRVAREAFSRSGGPGGQNVNKVNTRVTLHVPIAELELAPYEADRIRAVLGNRINAADELVVSSAETRSQLRNREVALTRAVNLIGDAMVQRKTRRSTRPTRASRERRLEQKRRAGAKKSLRRPPEE